MKVVVPSLGRAGTATTMKWLPSAGRPITFAIHEDERDEYEKAYPDCDILILSETTRHHTGLIRKEIMAHMGEPFFFVDDDIRISLKAVPTVDQVFNVLERHMGAGATMAGIAPQFMSTGVETELINGDPFAKRNKFVATVYAIDPAIFDNCPLEVLPVYEDVALVIHAIRYGGGTIVTYTATHNNVSPPSGGCNSWRDKKVTIDSLKILTELYPGICTIRETNNTTHSQHIGIGLRTAWSKIKKVT